MNLFITILSSVSVILMTFLLFYTIKGVKRIPVLKKDNDFLENGPIVSVVIAAKDEGKHIEKTIQQLWKQTYKNVEIIFVNDRSCDETGIIMEKLKEQLKKEQGQVCYQTLHIEELPSGWLGKNHALYQGYLASRGEYLIFSDADIIFHENTISKVMKYVTTHQVEHLAMTPRFVCSSLVLKSFIHLFMVTFNILLTPWKVFEKGEKGKGVGVGAFNLIKKSVYEKLGTHQSFPMEPVDDITLGKRAHEVTDNQHFVIGKEWIEVEWYPNLKEAINGFKKNFFVAFDYKISNIIGFSIFLFLIGIYPFMGILFFKNINWFISVLSWLLLGFLYLYNVRKVSFLSLRTVLEIILLPFTILFYIYMMCLSAYTTLKNGGIYWRGTFYSIVELKEKNNIDKK